MVETSMKRRQFTTGSVFALAAGSGGVQAAAFGEADAAQAVRVALERGANAAVDQLGRADGFLGNPQVRIPLPGALNSAAKLLKATGQQKQVDELVTAMNRAAEAAVPQARKLLVSTAKSISVDDAIKIVRGGETSVTDYFAAKTRAPLAEQFLPIVTQATERSAWPANTTRWLARRLSSGCSRATRSTCSATSPPSRSTACS
jgi:Protein of unknown function (DUF4197)